jgi:hypothetical protein
VHDKIHDIDYGKEGAVVEEQREGIVLRHTLPIRGKVSLFDAVLGRVEAIIPYPHVRTRFVHGGLVHYQLKSRGAMTCACDLELIEVPEPWVQSDILFLHHILEVAWFFVPEHGQAHAAYQWLRTKLYTSQSSRVTAFEKKLLIGKFLALLGVYPSQALTKEMQPLFYLLSNLCDTIVSIEESDELHQQVQLWLLDCMQAHPAAHRFTTLRFVLTTDTHESFHCFI